MKTKAINFTYYFFFNKEMPWLIQLRLTKPLMIDQLLPRPHSYLSVYFKIDQKLEKLRFAWVSTEGNTYIED